MSMKIGIIGAGHAGVEAAKAARENRAEVTLFSNETVVPYYRPRLVALAFGQAEFSAIQIKPLEWYAQQAIALRLAAEIASLDPLHHRVSTAQGTESFDGLIMAIGSNPVLPPFVKDGGGFIWPLWNVQHAEAIRSRVGKGKRLVIVGGGILGIEAALHGVEAGMNVTIVELMSRLMPAQFGTRASCALLRGLEERGIRVVLGHGIASAKPGPTSVTLGLDKGEPLEADLCLVSIGARPDKSLATLAGLACERGVLVDEFLQTPAPHCYAAGDMIQFEGVTRCSMKESAAQGKLAGLNLMASLQGRGGQVYNPETVPLTFRSKNFEIYAIGAVSASGTEEQILDGSTETLIRALVLKDGVPVGVQMIGTREGFDSYAAEVKKAGKM
ncbi:MAG: FAD-dependent oxidoreductase [bacterium]|jgi:nitrite reductase (NADH) large subunit